MSSKEFTAKIFRWLHQVNGDDKLPGSAIKVAVRLASDFNEKLGGMAWPSCQTLSEDIGKSKATVIDMIRRLHARGHLQVEWGQQGKGHSNQYWLVEKGQPANLSATSKGQVSEAAKGQVPETKGQVSARKGQPADLILSRLIEDPSKEKKESHTSPPDSASPDSGKRDGRRKQKQKRKPGAEVEAAFDQFWAAYLRKEAKKAAREEYIKAVANGADPGAINAGAERFAIIERARIDREGKPEYTPRPARWIREERWTDPPPPGLVTDEVGTPIGIAQAEPEPTGYMAIARRLRADW
jgi:hypothetical protein